MGEERHARRLVRAVDTNVLIRFLIGDDSTQSALARRILGEGAFVPLTVLLETAWVLRSNYKLSAVEVARAIEVILSLPTVDVPEPDLVRWAVRRSANGAQLADMIHIAASRHHEAFATFDRDIARHAGRDSPIPIETLGTHDAPFSSDETAR